MSLELAAALETSDGSSDCEPDCEPLAELAAVNASDGETEIDNKSDDDEPLNLLRSSNDTWSGCSAHSSGSSGWSDPETDSDVGVEHSATWRPL